MILKFKYNADSCLLAPYQSYTLGQNSHLSEQIIVISTAVNPQDYNYTLEFVCYNTKSVPKANYISKTLNYANGGIMFFIPNNLTQYRGHVDMQLTGYRKSDDSVVFKSICKNAKAFEVEGSLSVLESALSDTPNVLTEVMHELDYVREIKETLTEQFIRDVNNEFRTLMGSFKWHRVTLWVLNEKISSFSVIEGTAYTPPDGTEFLPPNTQIWGGWYDIDTKALWTTESTVQKDTNLRLNIKSIGLTVLQYVVGEYTGTDPSLYVPAVSDNKVVTSLSSGFRMLSADTGVTLHLPDTITDFTGLNMHLAPKTVTTLDVIEGNDGLHVKANCLYRGGDIIRLPAVTADNTIHVPYIAPRLSEKAVYETKLKTIRFDEGLQAIGGHAFTNSLALTKLILPASICKLESQALQGCIYAEICLKALTPPEVTEDSLPLAFSENGNLYPNVYVYPAVLDAYATHPLWSACNLRSMDEWQSA